MSKLTLSKYKDIEVFLEPFHSKIMRLMKDLNEPMTVTEIADAMKLMPAKVYYHVKKLEAIGVLYVKYTKQINGIVAKYYDFTTDTVALEVPDDGEDNDSVKSLVMKEYGHYFDEAKQKFFDLYSDTDSNGTKNDNNVYINVKDSFTIDPKKFDDFFNGFKELLEKYEYKGKEAVSYNLFLAIMKNVKSTTAIPVKNET
jgi:predicted transcriptional regulator